MAKHLAKLTARHPAEIKPGMVFTNAEYQQYIEIKSGPTQAANSNLRGDAAQLYEVRLSQGDKRPTKSSMSKAELDPKNGWKYIMKLDR